MLGTARAIIPLWRSPLGGLDGEYNSIADPEVSFLKKLGS